MYGGFVQSFGGLVIYGGFVQSFGGLVMYGGFVVYGDFVGLGSVPSIGDAVGTDVAMSGDEVGERVFGAKVGWGFSSGDMVIAWVFDFKDVSNLVRKKIYG